MNLDYEKNIGNDKWLEWHQGVKDGKNMICPRKAAGYKSGEGLHLCQAGHAERNAIVQAARSGVSTNGATLYCYCGQVCKDCAIEIINSGITTLVYLDGCDDYDKYSSTLLRESAMGGVRG